MWTVVYLPGAASERDSLDSRERAATTRRGNSKRSAQISAIRTAVQGADRLRELRPRAGRSAFRALYRQVGGLFVIAAIGPEALHNRKGFGRACRAAETRLGEIEE